MSLRGGAAIVGVAESDLGEVGPGFTPLDLIGQATSRALDDAGLEKEDVDGLFSASAYYHILTLSVGEYLSIRYTVRKRPYPHSGCHNMNGMRVFRTSPS
jgi:3-oxoacyl-[acyl-carrier-protein] synthase III